MLNFKRSAAVMAAACLLAIAAGNATVQSFAAGSSVSRSSASTEASSQTTSSRYSSSSSRASYTSSNMPVSAVTSTYSAADGSSLNLDSIISDHLNSGSQSDSSGIDESSSEIDRGYRIERPEPDTSGNASIVKSEKIIFNSETMQFIAVTTKDGHVFYVLINYSAEEDEDNVYFLNKVDDYDLYALLHGEDENDSRMYEDVNGMENDLNYNAERQEGLFESGAESENSAVENQPDGAGGKNQSMLSLTIVILAGGGAGGYFLYKKKKNGNSSEANNESDADYDYDFDDDVEINEDEELK